VPRCGWRAGVVDRAVQQLPGLRLAALLRAAVVIRGSVPRLAALRCAGGRVRASSGRICKRGAW
jgi:hypothetical protein